MATRRGLAPTRLICNCAADYRSCTECRKRIPKAVTVTAIPGLGALGNHDDRYTGRDGHYVQHDDGHCPQIAPAQQQTSPALDGRHCHSACGHDRRSKKQSAHSQCSGVLVFKGPTNVLELTRTSTMHRHPSSICTSHRPVVEPTTHVTAGVSPARTGHFELPSPRGLPVPWRG